MPRTYTVAGYYRSRRHQLLDEARSSNGDTRHNLKLLFDGAIIGACAERDRVLKILRRHGLNEVEKDITSVAIKDVLEIPDPRAKRRKRR